MSTTEDTFNSNAGFKKSDEHSSTGMSIELTKGSHDAVEKEINVYQNIGSKTIRANRIGDVIDKRRQYAS